MSTRIDWRRWAWRAGVAAVLLGMLGPVLATRSESLLGTVAGTADQGREAPCLPGEPVEIMDSPHISAAEAEAVTYLSVPPTSGPHFAFPAAPGVYGAPVAEGLTVHAMEHGHIVIQYAPGTPDAVVADLTRLAKRYGADVLLAPYPPLAHGIALTAWGRIDLLDSYDEERIVRFVEALRGRYDHGWTGDDEC